MTWRYFSQNESFSNLKSSFNPQYKSHEYILWSSNVLQSLHGGAGVLVLIRGSMSVDSSMLPTEDYRGGRRLLLHPTGIRTSDAQIQSSLASSLRLVETGQADQGLSSPAGQKSPAFGSKTCTAQTKNCKGVLNKQTDPGRRNEVRRKRRKRERMKNWPHLSSALSPFDSLTSIFSLPPSPLPPLLCQLLLARRLTLRWHLSLSLSSRLSSTRVHRHNASTHQPLHHHHPTHPHSSSLILTRYQYFLSEGVGCLLTCVTHNGDGLHSSAFMIADEFMQIQLMGA